MWSQRASVLTAVLVLLAWFPAFAEPYAEGATLPALKLEDQHGEPRPIDGDVRAVLFARDMDGGGVIKQVLSERGAALLAATGAVYVADVSGMPGLIRRVFAIPRLRRRGYPILLDTKGEATQAFPAQAGKATLMQLDALRLVKLRYFETPDALRQALDGLRPASESDD